MIRVKKASVMKISIVTVCYNDSYALVPTLLSIGKQTYDDIEVIVQDGASTDGTPEIVKMFGNWITKYESKPDTGIYQAMNRAIEKCTGEFAVFMNAADRFLTPTSLEELVAEITPRDDVIYGYSQSEETGQVHKYRPENMYWAGMTFDHQATAVKTSLLKKHKYREGLKISGDYDLMSRMRLSGANFRQIDKVVAIKPFEYGASSGFVDRFRDRYNVALQHFGEEYPVRSTLLNELVNHVVVAYGAEFKREELLRMEVEEILAFVDKLDAIMV